MDWTTILTGIGTVVGVGIAVYTVGRNFKKDINDHIDKLDIKLGNQTKRIDHLYQISVELLRERKVKGG